MNPALYYRAAAAVLAAYAGLLAGCSTQSRGGRDLNAVIANDRLCGVSGACK